MDVTIKHEYVDKFVLDLLSSYEVIAPVARDGRFIFDKINSPAEVSLKYNTTILPPVKWIYPDNEKLLEFDLKDIAGTKPVIQGNKQALTFVHPCDINAINIMDEILAEEPADVNYLRRRRGTVIIGYECPGPCRENILCFDKGYYAVNSGFDLLFTDLGDMYYVHVGTDVGEAIVEGSKYFKRAAYEEWLQLLNVREERKHRFKKSINGNIEMLSHVLKESYNDEIWDIEGKKCVSCGACNIVCPTCYCFDVADEMCPDMEKGARYRKLDGCQLRGFCKVATGENFRKTAAERVRHRVFKKEVYLKKRFGKSGCVGCGRCIEHCIAKISIIDIFNHVMAKSGSGQKSEARS